MALLPVTHKPVTGYARQFDGTLEAFLDIIDARPKAGLTVTCTFDAKGDFAGLSLSGGGTSVTLNKGGVDGNGNSTGDWIVFPADPAEPAVALSDAAARAAWQP